MSEETLATLESATETPEAVAAQPAAPPADGEASGEPETVAAEPTAAAAPEDSPESEPAESSEPEAVGSSEPEAAGSAEPEAAASTEPEAAASTEPEAAASTEPEAAGAAEPEAAGSAEPEAAASTEPEAVRELRRAMEADEPVKGKVIGWNNGGFHVVVGDMTAFCPRSEIEIEAPKAPKSYLDKELVFRILKIQRGGKRIVLSRSAHLKNERRMARQKIKQDLRPGTVRSGRVASITDFGAFVDLDGIQGLVHVSELSRRRVDHPREVVEIGQEVEVKILRVESGGRRISLSMKALEPDPWEGIESRFEEGSLVTGTVERTVNFGAFIQVAPGLTGLLPTSAMGLPRGASAARKFTPGKQVAVQIQSVDRRRRRISLSLEGSTTEGSRKDFESYRREQTAQGGGFNALAAALEKARRDDA